MCGLEEAVSVACIDLAYSVQFKQNKVKDEKRDTTSVSFALDDTIHNQPEDENDDDFSESLQHYSVLTLCTLFIMSLCLSVCHNFN